MGIVSEPTKFERIHQLLRYTLSSSFVVSVPPLLQTCMSQTVGQQTSTQTRDGTQAQRANADVGFAWRLAFIAAHSPSSFRDVLLSKEAESNLDKEHLSVDSISHEHQEICTDHQERRDQFDSTMQERLDN